MRIALVIDNFNLGGGIIFLYRLVKELPEINFGVFGKKGKYTKIFKELKNVKIVDSGFSPNYIADFSPDVVHINHLKPLISWFSSLHRQKTPVIFTAHGLHVHKYEFKKGTSTKIKYFLRQNLEKILFHRVDKVVAVSKADKEYLERYYRLSNVVYLPNGIDPKSLLKNRKEKKKLQFVDNFFIFLTIARFDFQKGYDVLIEAISLVNHHLPKDVRFILVGGGPLFIKMKNIVKRKGLEGRIIFAGEIVNSHSLWANAHVFVLPSRWEGLPTVILEAGIYKKPVIASATYGNTELVNHGKTGLLFPNENAYALGNLILEATRNYNQLIKMGENLHKEVMKNYHIKNCVSRYKRLYESFY